MKTESWVGKRIYFGTKEPKNKKVVWIDPNEGVKEVLDDKTGFEVVSSKKDCKYIFKVQPGDITTIWHGYSKDRWLESVCYALFGVKENSASILEEFALMDITCPTSGKAPIQSSAHFFNDYQTATNTRIWSILGSYSTFWYKNIKVFGYFSGTIDTSQMEFTFDSEDPESWVGLSAEDKAALLAGESIQIADLTADSSSGPKYITLTIVEKEE